MCPLVGFEADPSVLGQPRFVMSFVDGVIRLTFLVIPKADSSSPRPPPNSAAGLMPSVFRQFTGETIEDVYDEVAGRIGYFTARSDGATPARRPRTDDLGPVVDRRLQLRRETRNDGHRRRRI
jgi:hypothetical protein